MSKGSRNHKLYERQQACKHRAITQIIIFNSRFNSEYIEIRSMLAFKSKLIVTGKYRCVSISYIIHHSSIFDIVNLVKVLKMNTMY